MNTKRTYESPMIACIKLDNEISLILASDPPVGPNEALSDAPESFVNLPFKTHLG